MDDLKTPVDALRFALTLIESYQSDIRNSEWTGVDLLKEGFCQGKVYRNGTLRIAAALDKFDDSPRLVTYMDHFRWNQTHDLELQLNRAMEEK